MGPSRADAQKLQNDAVLNGTKVHTQGVGIRGPYIRELIPPNAGTGPYRKIIQARTLAVWSAAALLGAAVFYQPFVDIEPQNRAAALGLVFPGAGYLASGTWLGVFLLVLTVAALPPALFAWFGAGAIVFPLLVWALSILGARATVQGAVWQPAGIYSLVTLFSGFLYVNRSASAERVAAQEHRQVRNGFLQRELQEIDEAASEAAVPEEDRELDIDVLRRLQFVFDAAFQNLDDWSSFNRIDQFQTAALRYQIYQMMYCLGLYQTTYAPNAHGFVKEAFERIIERSLTRDVLNFWKWERLMGKFSLDWDPVKQDNIMVTGFLLQGVMLYTAITGDLRYTKPGSLVFNVDDGLSYKYSVHDLQETLVRQWSASPYCLIPCEPNWIYVMCNLQGITGAFIYDRFFKTNTTEVLLPIFEESLNTNFTDPSGSVLPIRSELTGFTIPGLCGTVGDLAAVMMGSGPLRNFSRRLWAIVRHENIQYDEASGEISVSGLVGADKIDQGNYRSSEWAIYTQIAMAAGEHGDIALKKAAMEKAERGFGTITTSTGAKCLNLSKTSTLINLAALTASLIQPGDYERMVKRGLTEAALSGPILSEVPYPGVLVVNARSHTSRDLEVVLYPSEDAGTFSLVVSRLTPGVQYKVQGGVVTADEDGKASFSVIIDGRTRVHIQPVEE